jgi:predicted O-methyltransferase YrrM
MSSEHFELWTRSDEYHNSFLIKEDPILESVQTNSKEKGIEYDIAVSPALGKFLNLVLLSIDAKRVLEVGSLAG